MKERVFFLMMIQLIICATVFAQHSSPEWEPEHTETWEPVPLPVFQDQNYRIPSDALVLFDGKDLSQWKATEWYVEGGLMITKPGTGVCYGYA